MTGEGSDWDIKKYLDLGEDWWPPHEVRVELVEGCALRCHSCGISGIRGPDDGRLRFAARGMVERIAREMGRRVWKSVLSFTGRGEMCHHPQIDDCIMLARDASILTPILLETSGAGLVDLRLARHETIGPAFVNRTNSLMENGLTCMVLNRRAGAEKIWDAVDDMAEDACHLLGARLERSYLHHIPGPFDRALCLVRDVIRAPAVQHNRATAHCGAGAKPYTWRHRYKKDDKFCGRPAQEMVVRFDGMVTLCQEDWRGEMCLGDANTESLYDIWYSAPARAARARGLAGVRSLGPCSKCDWSGDARMMLRADHMRARPEPWHHETFQATILPEPLTVPVRRPWEA